MRKLLSLFFIMISGLIYAQSPNLINYQAVVRYSNGDVVPNKIVSLKSVLKELLPDHVYDPNFILDNGKEITTVYVVLENVSIHNKATWQETMYFLKDRMAIFEEFWETYEDYIKS